MKRIHVEFGNDDITTTSPLASPRVGPVLLQGTASLQAMNDLEIGIATSQSNNTEHSLEFSNHSSSEFTPLIDTKGRRSILPAYAKDALDYVEEAAEEAWQEAQKRRHYDWREFWRGGGVIRFMRWIMTGTVPAQATISDDEVQDNLNSLARMLSLLREYHDLYGMPQRGGPKDQAHVLREVTKDLYYGGTPIWALAPVMRRVAEGLTGTRGIDFLILPRQVFIASRNELISMFRITRYYDLQRLDNMEIVAVRLASFASNTSSVASIPSRWLNPRELTRAFRTESLSGLKYTKEEMTSQILSLASEAEGLFFYVNSNHEMEATRGLPKHRRKNSELGDFWSVEDHIRELFSRLACIEAANTIDKLDAERKPLYSKQVITFFRVGSSAGACAFWFHGSWIDIFVSGLLAVFVARIGSSPILSKHERIVFEAVASLLVGFIAALISLTWPHKACFGAMAISGVLDLLQGFRVVYSIIEIMSKHTVTGGADFLEGVFFTALIAYFLRFGQYIAVEIKGPSKDNEFLICDKGLSEWWYVLFVPLAAVCWSGLFNPNYFDLPFMAAHGVLGYVVSWQFQNTNSANNLNNFLAAMVVTFSAGLFSRFYGRQALGNTVAGIYVLLPGAYLVDKAYSDQLEGFLTSIILRAVVIGVGAWTGTVLCSPTLLGFSKGLLLPLQQQQQQSTTTTVPWTNRQGSELSEKSVSSCGSSSAGRTTWRRRTPQGHGHGGGLIYF